MDFEGGDTRHLVMLARRAVQDDQVDKGRLCAAAIRAVNNPPRDGILRSLANHVCQATFDWACFDGSRARLEGVVESYETAASALQVEERLGRLRH